MVNEVIVRIGKTEKNYAAIVEGLEGFVCTADSLEELKKEVSEGIDFHIAGLKEDGDRVPEIFTKVYRLIYKWSIESLLLYYKGVLTLSALERITGINQTQLGHYAAGRSVPRKKQVEKIERSLHHLGNELSSISF
jgi:predicted RNase H-like HicB family nuclease